jgi:iron only hydrogenase large subunit-like protein
MKTTSKQTATVTLSDCLACSGCVTSAETVLISQQSLQQFTNVIQQCVTGFDQIKIDSSSSSSSNIAINDVSSATFAPIPIQQRKRIVLSLSPQSRTALAHHFNIHPLALCKKLQYHLQHAQHLQMRDIQDTNRPQSSPQQQSAFAALLDTSSLNEVALREAAHEFCSRWRLHHQTTAITTNNHTATTTSTAASAASLKQQQSEQPLPLLTSECPGVVVYSEKTQPVAILRHLSHVQSPQQLCGSIVKYHLAQHELSLKPKQVYHVTVMPCFEKKIEAHREDFYDSQTDLHTVDCVLTTDEFRIWLEQDQQIKNKQSKIVSSNRIESSVDQTFRNYFCLSSHLNSPHNSSCFFFSCVLSLSLFVSLALCRLDQHVSIKAC